MDDSLLVCAEAALHYEGVFLSSDQVEVRSEVTIDVPGLTELSQTWELKVRYKTWSRLSVVTFPDQQSSQHSPWLPRPVAAGPICR